MAFIEPIIFQIFSIIVYLFDEIMFSFQKLARCYFVEKSSTDELTHLLSKINGGNSSPSPSYS